MQVLHEIGVAVEEAGRGEHAEGHAPRHGQEGVRAVRVHLKPPQTPSSRDLLPRSNLVLCAPYWGSETSLACIISNVDAHVEPRAGAEIFHRMHHVRHG